MGTLPHWGWIVVLLAIVELAASFWCARQEPVLALDRCGHPRRQRRRAGLDPADAPDLVAVDDRARTRRGLRAGRVRQTMQRSRSGHGVLCPSVATAPVPWPAPRPTVTERLLPSGDLDGGGLNDSMQWRRWHRSAQKVDRAWSEWLAGDGQRAARPGIFKRATRDEACVRHRWTERHGHQRKPWRGG